MISKGKRRYLVWLYWYLAHPHLTKFSTGKHRTSFVDNFLPSPGDIIVDWSKAEKNLTGESHAWKSDHIPTVQDQAFVKEVATKGYYDGVKRLDSECELEVFFGIDTLGPNAKTITISRSTISGIDKGQPKFESVDLIEVPNDFKEAREKTL